jgi:hypothetical protein
VAGLPSPSLTLLRPFAAPNFACCLTSSGAPGCPSLGLFCSSSRCATAGLDNRLRHRPRCFFCTAQSVLAPSACPAALPPSQRNAAQPAPPTPDPTLFCRVANTPTTTTSSETLRTTLTPRHHAAGHDRSTFPCSSDSYSSIACVPDSIHGRTSISTGWIADPLLQQ